jgi:hypothetical protein
MLFSINAFTTSPDPDSIRAVPGVCRAREDDRDNAGPPLPVGRFHTRVPELLTRLEGATPFEISRALKVSLDDAKLQSERMIEAEAIWKKTLKDPYWYLPERSGWRRGRNLQVGCALIRLLYADVAVCLVGEAIPPQLGHLSLRQKAILYSLLVEYLDWDGARELVGCTSWEIRIAVREGMSNVREICGEGEIVSSVSEPAQRLSGDSPPR